MPPPVAVASKHHQHDEDEHKQHERQTLDTYRDLLSFQYNKKVLNERSRCFWRRLGCSKVLRADLVIFDAFFVVCRSGHDV